MTNKLFLTFLLLCLSFATLNVAAHEAPKDPRMSQFQQYMPDQKDHQVPGESWHYDAYCCSNKDCAPIPDTAVTTQKNGYLIQLNPGDHPMIKTTMQYFVPFNSDKIKESQDTRFHACITLYEPENMRCFYIPPGGV